MSVDIDRAREEFHARNAAAVKHARERIEEFRQQALSTFEATKSEREKLIAEVSRTLEERVDEIQRRHRLVRKQLNQMAISRDVHVRVSRSLGAIEDFIRVQRGINRRGKAPRGHRRPSNKWFN